MIYHGRGGRRGAHVARSQLAVRLALALYSAVCAAVVLRCAILSLGFPATVWSAEAVLAVTSPIARPLTMIGPANRTLIGAATLADLTALLLVVAIPIPLLGRSGSVRAA
jgi:hypothetical protein